MHLRILMAFVVMSALAASLVAAEDDWTDTTTLGFKSVVTAKNNKLARDKQLLKVSIAVENETNGPLNIRYVFGYFLDVELKRADGSLVKQKANYRIAEQQAFEVSLEARKKTTLSESINFGDDFELSPGEYKIRFIYRPKTKVLWSKESIAFTVLPPGKDDAGEQLSPTAELLRAGLDAKLLTELLTGFEVEISDKDRALLKIADEAGKEADAKEGSTTKLILLVARAKLDAQVGKSSLTKLDALKFLTGDRCEYDPKQSKLTITAPWSHSHVVLNALPRLEIPFAPFPRSRPRESKGNFDE